MEKLQEMRKGLIVVFGISITAFLLGYMVPVVGGAGFGIIIGMVVASISKNLRKFEAGIEFSAKTLLHISIVLLGVTVNITSIAKTGIESLPVLILSISVSFLAANIFGKIFGLNFNMRNLIGAGTGICGGSAIAALSAVIKPNDKEISYSLSIIFLFNIIALFTFPIIGHIFNMSQHFFGMFAGSAINDTSSVAAAGYIYGDAAGKFAVTVKLTRTLAIIPIILIFSAIVAKKRGNCNKKTLFPWFITGFILMSILNTISDFIPMEAARNIKLIMTVFEIAGKFLIVMAITAIGLKTNLKNIALSGVKPLLTGVLTWISVVLTALFAQIYLM